MNNYSFSEMLNKAASIIKDGGCILYPTETFYALGASVLDYKAIERIVHLKSRPKEKPFPIIIGDLAQLAMITKWEAKDLIGLPEHFWPGPLSILMPAKKDLVEGLKDQNNMISVRLTSHPLAQRLCLKTEVPIVATSANKSGYKPAADPQDIDEELLQQVDMFLEGFPYPSGEKPSTIVKILGFKELRLIRKGVISRANLLRRGYKA